MIVTMVLISPLIGACIGKLLLRLCRLHWRYLPLEDFSMAELEEMSRGFE